MEKMLAVKCHRLWVVDQQQHLIGVVSLTDVIKAFLVEYPIPPEN